MKAIDIIFALIIGKVISFLLDDLLKAYNITLPYYEGLILWVLIPFFALFCLWISYLIGRKFLFIYQAAKHILVGAFATIVDLKIFELIIWISGFFAFGNTTLPKATSFLLSTILKYIGNKYWAFQKHEKEDLKKEVVQFFYITLFGLIVDITVFQYFSKITGPQFGLSIEIWLKLSVIFAALAAAIFNFLGYKFLVFKK